MQLYQTGLAPDPAVRDDYAMTAFPGILRLILAIVFATGLCGSVFAGQLTVFAAASLREALDMVANQFAQETGIKVTTSYAGTSSLARQIEYGAPADVLISASSDWMDYLEQAGHIVPASRFNLLSNRLVLIGPVDGAHSVTLGVPGDLSRALKGGRLAMALTNAVPAGIYGKSALEHMGLWSELAPSVAETDNVRAALALVAIGATPLGIVYETDALAETRVAVLDVFPADTHPKILYPVAATKDANDTATAAFLDYLHSEAAHAIFEEYGFLIEAN